MLCLIPLISSEGTKSGKEDLGYILYNSPDSDMIIKGFPLSLDLSNNSPSFQILDFPVHMEISISNVELGNSGNENSCLINLVFLIVNNGLPKPTQLPSNLHTASRKRFSFYFRWYKYNA